MIQLPSPHKHQAGGYAEEANIRDQNRYTMQSVSVQGLIKLLVQYKTEHVQ